MKNACLEKIGSRFPGLASSCLKRSFYQTKIFISQNNISKIHIKVVTKKIQYRKFPDNSSAVEEE